MIPPFIKGLDMVYHLEIQDIGSYFSIDELNRNKLHILSFPDVANYYSVFKEVSQNIYLVENRIEKQCIMCRVECDSVDQIFQFIESSYLKTRIIKIFLDYDTKYWDYDPIQKTINFYLC